MKALLNLFLASILVLGCGVTKQKTKQDNTVIEKTGRTIFKTRPGDTISLTLPFYKHVDTVITVYDTHRRVRATVTYDSIGNYKIECITQEIQERLDEVVEMIKMDVSENKNTSHSFDVKPLINAISVLCGVLIVGVLLFVFIKSKRV